MSIVDKVRDAIKKKNSEAGDDEKKEFNLSGSEEDKIREFETRADDMRDIMRELETAKVDTGEIRAKIKEAIREIV